LKTFTLVFEPMFELASTTRLYTDVIQYIRNVK